MSKLISLGQASQVTKSQFESTRSEFDPVDGVLTPIPANTLTDYEHFLSDNPAESEE